MNAFFGQIVLPVLFLLFLAATVCQLGCWIGVFGGFARVLCREGAPPSPHIKGGGTSSGGVDLDGAGRQAADVRTYHEKEITDSAELNEPPPFTGGMGGAPSTGEITESPISIVICARDEAENLRRHLPLWLSQEYACDWELLVVDDASNDDTPAILAFFQQNNTRLRVLQLAEKKSLGKKFALAQGIAAARYEHLVLTDADCAPAGPRWLAHMATCLAEMPDTEIALGYAPLSARPGLLNSWARFETAYTALQYFAFAWIGMPYMGVGRNLAWKRSLFQQAGGFVRHADLPSGDDDLLVNAVAKPGRVALCLTPDAFVYSAAKTTWAAWLRQKQRQLGSGLRYRWTHQVVLGAVAAAQTLHYFFALLLLLAGYHPVLVLAIWLLRLGLVLLVWRRILRGLEERELLMWVPVLDVLLAIYYAGFVPLVFLRGWKGVDWK